MKRSNDYIQANDGFKKPRVAQGYNYQGNQGAGAMGVSADIYGAGYAANSMMMMSAYSQMSGAGYTGADPSMAMAAPFQQYTATAFGTPYNASFQVSFPPARNAAPAAVRTVYVGNVPAEVTIHDVLDLVQTGNVESARLLPEKNCAFISFVEPGSAAAFHQRIVNKKPRLGDQELKVGWGKASPVPPSVLQAVQQGATRNVFVGSVDDTLNEEQMRSDFSAFGTVEDVKIMREKSIAFVHFTHIASAMKAVTALPLDPRYSQRRVNYGKDRCAKFAVTTSGSFPFTSPSYTAYGPSSMAFSPKFDRQGNVTGSGGGSKLGNPGVPMSILTSEGNRTVYLGNIAPDTQCEDLCNVIRGGILSNIRYLAPKHIAFVTFVDPEAAINFYNIALTQGCVVKSRRLKIGWGQNAHTLPTGVIQALSNGATRNVYIGGVEGVADVDKLRQDFSEFGEVEMVNILKEKNCGFVNFTNVLSAVKAVENIQRRPEYAFVKINYGKDRCGNPPREGRSQCGDQSGSNDNMAIDTAISEDDINLGI